MTPSEVLVMLDEVIAHATPEAKPGLALALTARLGTLASGIMASPATSGKGQEADRLLDMPAVAEYLGILEDRARDLGRRGELPVVTVGKYKRVRLSALVAYIEAHEKNGLDERLSGVLRSHRDQGRGKTAATATRAHAGGVCRVGRHASHHDLKVGNGRVAGRPAVVAAHGAAVEDAAAKAEA